MGYSRASRGILWQEIECPCALCRAAGGMSSESPFTKTARPIAIGSLPTAQLYFPGVTHGGVLLALLMPPREVPRQRKEPTGRREVGTLFPRARGGGQPCQSSLTYCTSHFLAQTACQFSV